jgi:hypothetical protein
LGKQTPLAEMGKNGNNKNTDMRRRIWYKILLLTPHSATLALAKLSSPQGGDCSYLHRLSACCLLLRGLDFLLAWRLCIVGWQLAGFPGHDKACEIRSPRRRDPTGTTFVSALACGVRTGVFFFFFFSEFFFVAKVAIHP